MHTSSSRRLRDAAKSVIAWHFLDGNEQFSRPSIVFQTILVVNFHPEVCFHNSIPGPALGQCPDASVDRFESS